MKEKIRHLIAEKLMEKGKTKLSLRQLTQFGDATDKEINWLLDHIRSLEEEIELLERLLRQLKQ
ncbi:MAG: hypothetical protein ACO1N1_04620 [Dyadobacter fermentans]